MAEALIIGPLITLGVNVAAWAYKKHHQTQENREHDHESKKLMAAVDSLAIFVQERSHLIRFLHGDMVFHSSSLRIIMIYGINK